MQYEFHIYFTSFHCTGRYELNKLVNLFKLTLLPLCGFTAQLVEHRTGIAEVTGSNLVEAVIFFRVLPSNCLNWKIYCDDHSSLSSTTAVQYEFHIWYESRFSKICACATATGHRTKNNMLFRLRKDKEKNVAFELIRQVLFFHFS